MSKREPMKVTTKYATTRSGSFWLVESLGKRWTVWTCGMSCDCWTACDGRNRYMNPDGPTGSRAIAAVKSTLGLTSGGER